MPRIPRDRALDRTLALSQDGYRFISRTCRQLGTPIFETTFMLQRFICFTGEDAARVFYDENLFERKDVVPKQVRATLFGEGGVQHLDSELHRVRKEMFVSLMTPAGIDELGTLVGEELLRFAEKAEVHGQDVTLLQEAKEILCRAVCRWAMVPLAEGDVGQRTRDFSALIEGAATVGLPHWIGRLARQNLEQWLENLIAGVRASRQRAEDGSPLRVIARHRSADGRQLTPRIAAVELINVLRPTVAVAWYVTFAACALQAHPEWRERLLADDGFLERFVQKVRRFYPFFPFVAARSRTDFEWKGFVIPKGRKVALDLYGTNHDPAVWERPEEFLPDRFLKWNGSAYNFIPQGGGDVSIHHRCPGERITITVMMAAIRFLAGAVTFEVPRQNLEIDFSRMPARPRSGFVMRNLRTVMPSPMFVPEVSASAGLLQ